MNTIIIRVLTFIFVFVLVGVLPWWISALVLAGLTIYFPSYFEVVFFGFLFDVLYLPHPTFPYTGLTAATLFLMVVMVAKTQIRR